LYFLILAEIDFHGLAGDLNEFFVRF